MVCPCTAVGLSAALAAVVRLRLADRSAVSVRATVRRSAVWGRVDEEASAAAWMCYAAASGVDW